MGWDGAGNYNRVHNFSADASAGIKILASRMDAEINDMASAFTRVWTRDGQNTPTQDIPMGGRKFVNVGAPTSVGNFMRAREFIENVPIFMQDAETSADRVSVSSQYFTSVSANQAPVDGTKIMVRVLSNKSSAVLYLDGHSANIEYIDGGRIASALTSGGIYEFSYSSVDTAWQVVNPDAIASRIKYEITAAEILAGVTPTNYAYGEGVIIRYGATLASADNTTAINAAISVSANGGAPAQLPAGTWYGTATMLAGSKLVGQGSRLTVLKIPAGLAANTKIVSGASISQCRIEGFTVDYTGGTASTTGHGVYFSAVTRPVARDIRSLAAKGIGFYSLNSPEFDFRDITVETSEDWGMAIDGASTIGGYAENLFGKSLANRFLFMRSVQNVQVFGVSGISNSGTAAWMTSCLYCNIIGVSDLNDTLGDVAVIEGASIGCSIYGVRARSCGGHTASIAGLASVGAPQNCHIIDVYSDAAGESMAAISDQGSGFKPTNCTIRNVSGKNCGRVTPSEAFVFANTDGCTIQGQILDTLGDMTWACRETGAAPTANRFEISGWVEGTSGYFSMSASNSGIDFPRLEKGTKRVGDADTTFDPAEDGHLILYDQAALTAERTATLNDSWPGDRVRVSRVSAGAFNLLVKNAGGTTLKTLATAALWEDFYFDGTNWTAVAGTAI